jgi:hypothetical protein
MTVINCAGLLACLILLGACEPALKDVNERGGTVTNAAGMEGRKAFALARAHCLRFGRDAKVAGELDVMSNLLTFDCVP